MQNYDPPNLYILQSMGEINLDEGVGKAAEKLKIYYSTLMLAFSDLRCAMSR